MAGSEAAEAKSDVHPDGFRGPQACKIVGISYRQLDYWARTSLVTPSISDASGSGSQRHYSYQDLLELKLVKQLLDGGLSLPAVRKSLFLARDIMSETAEPIEYLVVGPNMVLVRHGEDILDLLRGGQLQLGLVVSIQELESRLNADIAAFNPRGTEMQLSLFEVPRVAS